MERMEPQSKPSRKSAASSSTGEVLIQAAKTLLSTKQRDLLSQKGAALRQKRDCGAFKLFLANQKHKQAVLLRRADQNWNTQKQLRIMQGSVRHTVASKKDKLKDLHRLNQSILDLQEIVSLPGASREAPEKPLETRLLAKILKSDATKKVAANAEVDGEVGECQELQGREKWNCPTCGMVLLVEHVGQHVEFCIGKRGGNAAEEGRQRKERRHTGMRVSGFATQEICSLCGEKVLSSKLEVHLVQCKDRILKSERTRRRDWKREKLDDFSLYAQMVSQPPRNVRVTETSSVSIKIGEV